MSERRLLYHELQHRVDVYLSSEVYKCIVALRSTLSNNFKLAQGVIEEQKMPEQ